MNTIHTTILLATAAVLFLAGPAAGFAPRPVTAPLSTSSSLAAYPSKDRVVQVGGGIPVVPAGDYRLFDPRVEGMLGGTDSLAHRLSEGAGYEHGSYLPAEAPPRSDLPTVPAQAWREHFDPSTRVPPVFAKASQPVTATVLGRARAIAADAPGDIQHVVMKLPDGFEYAEGQSLSVIPPGTDPSTGRPYKPRLYSIASTRYGDLLDGTTVSLCVRRALYYDPATGLEDPTKKGVCSNFLCDVAPGTPVSVAGPVGKTMLLPEDPATDLIMVATGTGIAPFRAFLHRLFVEETTAKHLFTGTAWLILGVPTTGGLLYPQEFAAMQAANPGQLEVQYAISREQTNASGGKYYVQDALADRSDELFRRLENGAHVYFCGLKGMMPGILEALEGVAESRGLDWAATLSRYKKNGQWHVEVY